MLRRNISFALFALVSLSGFAVAAWDYQYNATDYGTTAEALTAYTNNWTSTYPTSGTPSLTVAQDAVSSANALMFNNGATGAASYGLATYKNTIEYGDQFRFEMKFRVANTTVASGTNQMIVSFSKNYGDSTYGTVWFMIRNTGITAYNSSGSWTNWFGSLNYTWHTLGLDANFETKTYDIYVDSIATPVLQISMASTNLAMRMGDGSGNVFGQTNVEYIQWGTVPEPASVMLLLAGTLGGLLKRRRK